MADDLGRAPERALESAHRSKYIGFNISQTISELFQQLAKYLLSLKAFITVRGLRTGSVAWPSQRATG